MAKWSDGKTDGQMAKQWSDGKMVRWQNGQMAKQWSDGKTDGKTVVRWPEKQAHPLHPTVSKIKHSSTKKRCCGLTEFDAQEVLVGSIRQIHLEYCEHGAKCLVKLDDTRAQRRRRFQGSDARTAPQGEVAEEQGDMLVADPREPSWSVRMEVATTDVPPDKAADQCKLT